LQAERLRRKAESDLSSVQEECEGAMHRANTATGDRRRLEGETQSLGGRLDFAFFENKCNF